MGPAVRKASYWSLAGFRLFYKTVNKYTFRDIGTLINEKMYPQSKWTNVEKIIGGKVWKSDTVKTNQD